MDFRRNEHLKIDTHAAPHAPLTTYRIADNWFSGTYTTALRDALPTEMTDSIAASTTASIEVPSTITTSNSGAASLAGTMCPSTMNSTAVLFVILSAMAFVALMLVVLTCCIKRGKFKKKENHDCPQRLEMRVTPQKAKTRTW
ncbi:hypothetical protein HBI71_000270 [Parastagonospora nodorum]|nr:hypothetical protein HBI71_000270 [Parastagonospora nodorum]KAH5424785.1 hypothetical protein HBI47_121590 [Parastagonospora nodorum]